MLTFSILIGFEKFYPKISKRNVGKGKHSILVLYCSNFICVKLVKRLLVKVFGQSTAIDTWVFVCEKLFKSISNP